MREHVDAESLALCAEGLLSRRRSERIRSHVASCPECATARARLTEVPALLAQVPPPPVPPGIAARLDAALSAEITRRAEDAGTASDHAAPARPPRPGQARGRRLRMPAGARGLAVAGVLVAAGGVGYAVSQSGSSPSSSSSSSAGRAAAPSAPTGGGTHSAASANGAAAPAGRVQFAVRRSGTSYRRSTLAAQAAAQLAIPSAGLARPGKASGGLARRAPGAAVTQCVANVTGAAAVQADEVKLVDQARYQGRPATIIVVQATPAQPGTVYVARCSASPAVIVARASLPASG